MSQNSSSGASRGGLPLIFLGASVYSYFQFRPEIVDTADRVIAAIGTGIGTSISGSVGMWLGGLGLAAVFGLAARSTAAAAVGGVLGLIGGGVLGVWGGYNVSADFMKDLMTDNQPAVSTQATTQQKAAPLAKTQPMQQMTLPTTTAAPAVQ